MHMRSYHDVNEVMHVVVNETYSLGNTMLTF